MNSYITGNIIKKLREEKKLTQSQLAAKLRVSDKAVSKWETGRGYPDITLIEPLADALGVSVIELISGDAVKNRNRAFNMKQIKFYVCPVCGNIITSTGQAVICCCGVNLPVQEAENADTAHTAAVEIIEDEYYVSLAHPMEKGHYISFIAAVGDNGVQIVKLYPEAGAEARFKVSRTYALYAYCNRHGLFRVMINAL